MNRTLRQAADATEKRCRRARMAITRMSAAAHELKTHVRLTERILCRKVARELGVRLHLACKGRLPPNVAILRPRVDPDTCAVVYSLLIGCNSFKVGHNPLAPHRTLDLAALIDGPVTDETAVRVASVLRSVLLSSKWCEFAEEMVMLTQV